MSREVRRVPANWQHPRDGYYANGSIRYKPLLKGPYSKILKEWQEEKAKWKEGLQLDYSNNWPQERNWKPLDEPASKYSFREWVGLKPQKYDYMPEWPEEKCTHLMMYETCTEGTPISPAFEKAEDLARWLADNNASAFGSMTASYEAWLATIKAGWAMSAVIGPDGVKSGVEAHLEN